MMTSSRAAGFTLLEMLIALAVLGLLAVLLGGSVQFGARAWEGQSRRLEMSSETDAVHTVLRVLLRNAQAMPLAGVGQPGGSLFLAGQRDAVDFVGELPEAFGRGGFYDMALAVKPDGRLVLRWRPHMGQSNAATEPPSYDEAELLHHVAALEMSYYGSAAKNRSGAWQSTWDQGSALPALIRVRLRFAAGDRRVWQDLQVAPVISRAKAASPEQGTQPEQQGQGQPQPQPQP